MDCDRRPFRRRTRAHQDERGCHAASERAAENICETDGDIDCDYQSCSHNCCDDDEHRQRYSGCYSHRRTKRHSYDGAQRDSHRYSYDGGERDSGRVPFRKRAPIAVAYDGTQRDSHRYSYDGSKCDSRGISFGESASIAVAYDGIKLDSHRYSYDGSSKCDSCGISFRKNESVPVGSAKSEPFDSAIAGAVSFGYCGGLSFSISYRAGPPSCSESRFPSGPCASVTFHSHEGDSLHRARRECESL